MNIIVADLDKNRPARIEQIMCSSNAVAQVGSINEYHPSTCRDRP